MREIKCRAKRIDNGEWVYGSYVFQGGWHYIVVVEYLGDGCSDCGCPCVDWHLVDAETVGQYTGLKDKNGKEIYEWDVVRFIRNVGPIYKPTIASDVGVVKWIGERASFRLCYNTLEQKIHSSYSSKYEVIGNIHKILNS